MALEWIFVNLGINVWLQGRVILKTYALRIEGKGVVCDWIEQ
jgi:hypothetical protein